MVIGCMEERLVEFHGVQGTEINAPEETQTTHLHQIRALMEVVETMRDEAILKDMMTSHFLELSKEIKSILRCRNPRELQQE